MDSVFHRVELALDMTTRLLDAPPTSAVRSGLFLAAPRRTGKSTFLREDLVPALRNAGALVLYIDLWRDRDADPGEVIVNEVAAALAAEKGALRRAVSRVGDASLSVGSVSVSLGGRDSGSAKISTTAALASLSEETGRVIALIIDEAQHAITTEAGTNALFGLKAARDELNSSAHHGLRVIATGSSRDKLAMLRASKDQAFFGAPLVAFPPLGKDYVRWFVEQQAFGDALDIADVTRWFERAGHRPEFLGAAAESVNFQFDVDEASVTARLEEALEHEVAMADEAILELVRSLRPLQSAVLREMASKGRGYAPFEGQTMKRYAETIQRIDANSGIVPSTTNVQAALESLKQRGLVWRASRGVYALEDAPLAELMRAEGMID